ncbi:hypothetical protein BGZ65_010713 [Modicella reniformis]|uniref:Uncharacterized protein n=1 Tax=Modicella reniformis TaxID=1440133 RepID=A0A9P6MAN6_9FUNG|nr:hypothetical protein BGZ65_010713 [Modicella reniformis]
MGEQEIDWILEHWKRLREVNGEFDAWDSEINSAYKERLGKHGVETAPDFDIARSFPACARVSKTWHQAFILLIWRDIEVTEHLPKAIHTHSHIQCNPTRMRRPKVPEPRVIGTNRKPRPGPKRVRPKHPHLSQTRAIQSLFNVLGQGTRISATKGFWDIRDENRQEERSRLERLNIGYLELTSRGNFMSMEFPNIKEIRLKKTTIWRCFVYLGGRAKVSWHDIVYWDSGDHEFISRFVYLVSVGIWPNLERVSSMAYTMSTKNLNRMIKGMRRITALDFDCLESFQSSSMKRLQPHFPHLKELILSIAPGLTSSMIRQVLTTCPLLEVLAVGMIDAAEVVRGKSWVCLRMKKFTACFRFEPLTFHRVQLLVFDQLSSLTQMEELNLDGTLEDSPINFPEFHETFDLRLSYGLDKLSTLRSLRYFAFW